MRPGVVWFGEKLPSDVLERINVWLDSSDRVDMVLVIGTERTPFLREAIDKGAEVVWFDVVACDTEDMGDGDWHICGDASKSLPDIIYSALALPYSGPTTTE